MIITEGHIEEEQFLISLPIGAFEHETKEFSRQNLHDFYNTQIFKKDYRQEGD